MAFSGEQIRKLRESADRHGVTPANCPNCEYDRRTGLPEGGWIWTDNNGPIVSCPMCNPDERHQRR